MKKYPVQKGLQTMNPIPTPNGFTLTCGRDALWIVNNMAGAERRVSKISRAVFVACFVAVESSFVTSVHVIITLIKGSFQ